MLFCTVLSGIYPGQNITITNRREREKNSEENKERKGTENLCQ
jgi:hypothetical protein